MATAGEDELEENGAGDANETLPVVPDGSEGLQVITLGEEESFYDRVVDFKKWTVMQFRVTRQYVSERAGWSGRTVDLKLTERVAKIRSSRNVYEALAFQAIRMHDTLLAMEKTHLEMAYLLSDMAALNSQMPAPLRPMMKCTSSAHLSVIGRNTMLVTALESFVSSISTLIQVAIDDTLAQVPNYKSVRLEYDAYRNKLERVKKTTEGTAAAYRQEMIKYAEDEFKPRLEKFMAVRREMLIRVRFLEQNEVSAMRKQLVLLQNAMCAFFSGDNDTMRKCLKDFHIRVPKVLHDPVLSRSAAEAMGENPLKLLPVGSRPGRSGAQGATAAALDGAAAPEGVSRTVSSGSSSQPESVDLFPPSSSGEPAPAPVE